MNKINKISSSIFFVEYFISKFKIQNSKFTIHMDALFLCNLNESQRIYAL